MCSYTRRDATRSCSHAEFADQFELSTENPCPVGLCGVPTHTPACGCDRAFERGGRSKASRVSGAAPRVLRARERDGTRRTSLSRARKVRQNRFPGSHSASQPGRDGFGRAGMTSTSVSGSYSSETTSPGVAAIRRCGARGWPMPAGYWFGPSRIAGDGGGSSTSARRPRRGALAQV